MDRNIQLSQQNLSTIFSFFYSSYHDGLNTRIWTVTYMCLSKTFGLFFIAFFILPRWFKCTHTNRLHQSDPISAACRRLVKLRRRNYLVFFDQYRNLIFSSIKRSSLPFEIHLSEKQSGKEGITTPITEPLFQGSKCCLHFCD